ncbi:unnamed protein product [Rotaria socialis]|uniref:Uncharacterized protein n=1 Tax=Rotaria socialis TaxID=392032 RepID=A0A818LA51_9BILA|nr:unnamed protein product [Rotaria socialis]CAF3569505.1 unnamed protein product [Rotaria socialis]
MGFMGHIGYPRDRFPILVKNILPHLNALCSLDLGQDTGFGLTNWYVTTIQCPLKYLRVPMEHIPHLCHVMIRETLSSTSEQFHVTVRSQYMERKNSLPTGLVLSEMINLHAFTLVESIFYRSRRIEWSTIESLTAPNVMVVLRRMKLFDRYPLVYDVWRTLPWALGQFFDSVEPIQYITTVEVFSLSPSYSSIISSSRLRTLSISKNDSLPSVISVRHVVQLDHINIVHLSFHDWSVGLNLLAIRRILH